MAVSKCLAAFNVIRFLKTTKKFQLVFFYNINVRTSIKTCRIQIHCVTERVFHSS